MCITLQNFVNISQTILGYHNFSTFEMAPSAILDFQNFKFSVDTRFVRATVHYHIEFHQNWLLIYSSLSFFSRWRPFAILDLSGAFWNHKRRVTNWGSFYCAKFGWNRSSSFDNTNVWIFCMFGLKMLICALIGVFWGAKMGNGNFMHIYHFRNAITQK